jgi:hypothetical protein
MTCELPSRRFGAPWSKSLTLTSALATFTVGVPAVYQLANGRLVISALLFAVLLLPVVLIVRHYEVAPNELRIRRLFWDTRWPLDGLTKATLQPNAMARSLRTWGNGGMFSFTGHFVNQPLGRYRAFVTDPARTVVLSLPKGVVVVSPDRPDEFIAAVTAAAVDGSRSS